MESVLLAALIAAASTSSGQRTGSPVALEQRCFRLMASLAEEEDPRIRGLGQMAAQYFLGRTDSAHPGFHPEAAMDAAAPQGAERQQLLGQCGDAMQAGGRDFRSIGQALAPSRHPSI